MTIKILKIISFIVFFYSGKMLYETAIGAVSKSKFKTIRQIAKEKTTEESSLEIIISKLAVKMQKFVYLDDYKKKVLDSKLKAIGEKESAEFFIASCFLQAALIAAIFLPLLFIKLAFFPLIIIVFAFIYMRAKQSIDSKLKKKREKIEITLPRFVISLTESLKYSRNLKQIVENYSKTAEPVLKEELEILSADMSTGNQELALKRFDSRLSSPMLSEVVRGMVSVLRGDDAVVYFQMLSHEFRQYEMRKLEKEAQKRPPKIRKWSFMLLILMALTYLVVMGYQAYEVASQSF